MTAMIVPSEATTMRKSNDFDGERYQKYVLRFAQMNQR